MISKPALVASTGFCQPMLQMFICTPVDSTGVLPRLWLKEPHRRGVLPLERMCLQKASTNLR